tara:strand:+ start:4504 stop:4953 length:450 start_codon:yes stop_codon:yes gene_type:complete
MAVRKAFSIEDGNLNRPSTINTRKRNYSDIDLTFTARTTGDVFKKNDAAAVKQSVKTILQTNYGERPFQPKFGADLRSKLFDNYTADENEFFVSDAVKTAIRRYEPRAKVLDVTVSEQPDRNFLGVQVEFQVIDTNEIVVLDTSISRIR